MWKQICSRWFTGRDEAYSEKGWKLFGLATMLKLKMKITLVAAANILKALDLCGSEGF